MEVSHIEFIIVSRSSMLPNRIVETNLGSYKLSVAANSHIRKNKHTGSIKRNR